MTWFAFKGYSTVDVAGVQEKDLVVAGFHGYSTKAAANAHPNSVNVLQKTLVNAAEEDYSTALSEQAEPGGKNASNPVAAGAQGAETAVGNELKDALGLPTFSNTRNFVIRASKVIVGLLLIAIGATKLLHVESAVKDVAPVVGKAAMV